jgi:hypothetical protein
MSIDLDELERLANAAIASEGKPTSDRLVTEADDEFYTAVSPEVVLRLLRVVRAAQYWADREADHDLPLRGEGEILEALEELKGTI